MIESLRRKGSIMAGREKARVAQNRDLIAGMRTPLTKTQILAEIAKSATLSSSRQRQICRRWCFSCAWPRSRWSSSGGGWISSVGPDDAPRAIWAAEVAIACDIPTKHTGMPARSDAPLAQTGLAP
jgi:hypothetical protein